MVFETTAFDRSATSPSARKSSYVSRARLFKLAARALGSARRLLRRLPRSATRRHRAQAEDGPESEDETTRPAREGPGRSGEDPAEGEGGTDRTPGRGAREGCEARAQPRVGSEEPRPGAASAALRSTPSSPRRRKGTRRPPAQPTGPPPGDDLQLQARTGFWWSSGSFGRWRRDVTEAGPPASADAGRSSTRQCGYSPGIPSSGQPLRAEEAATLPADAAAARGRRTTRAGRRGRSRSGCCRRTGAPKARVVGANLVPPVGRALHRAGHPRPALARLSICGIPFEAAGHDQQGLRARSGLGHRQPGSPRFCGSSSSCGRLPLRGRAARRMEPASSFGWSNYRGKRLPHRAHVPILNVRYKQDRCGPYRDWQNEEGKIQAHGHGRRSGLPPLPDAGEDDHGHGLRQGQLPRRRDLRGGIRGRARQRDGGGLVPLRERVAARRRRDDPTTLRASRPCPALLRLQRPPPPCLLAVRLRHPHPGQQRRQGVQRPPSPVLGQAHWHEKLYEIQRPRAPGAQAEVARREQRHAPRPTTSFPALTTGLRLPSPDWPFPRGRRLDPPLPPERDRRRSRRYRARPCGEPRALAERRVGQEQGRGRLVRGALHPRCPRPGAAGRARARRRARP